LTSHSFLQSEVVFRRTSSIFAHRTSR